MDKVALRESKSCKIFLVDHLFSGAGVGSWHEARSLSDKDGSYCKMQGLFLRSVLSRKYACSPLVRTYVENSGCLFKVL
jgi:hypothetical protein